MTKYFLLGVSYFIQLQIRVQCFPVFFINFTSFPFSNLTVFWPPLHKINKNRVIETCGKIRKYSNIIDNRKSMIMGHGPVKHKAWASLLLLNVCTRLSLSRINYTNDSYASYVYVHVTFTNLNSLTFCSISSSMTHSEGSPSRPSVLLGENKSVPSSSSSSTWSKRSAG